MFIFKGFELKKEIEGKLLFEGINIEISQGEHTALIGKNGIGKTTLIKGILGKLNWKAALSSGGYHWKNGAISSKIPLAR